MTPNNFRVKSGLTVGTTISGGNTTVTGFVNATSTVNAAGLAVGTAFIANSTGAYHTGTVNAASFTVGATVVANSTAVYATRLNSKTEANLNVNAATFSNTILVPDTRAVATTPETTSSPQVRFDFKQNTTDGLSDGGTYFGEMSFRPYGTTTDWSGGPAHQLGFTSNNNLYHRSGNSTTWGSWGRLYKEGTILTPGANVVLGSVGVSANGAFGTAGQVLHSNGTATYWAADDQGVTSVATANGLSGGPITSTGTIGVTTGPTLTVNTTGIHVNSALSITDLVLSGNLTVSGTTTYVNSTTLNVGDNIVTLNADLGAAAPTQDAGIEIMRGTSANVQFIWDETNDRWSTNGQSLAASSLLVGGTSLNSTVYAGTANNADYLDGQHGSYYTNATNITTGTLPYAQIPANVINTTANFTITGQHTYNVATWGVTFRASNSTNFSGVRWDDTGGTIRAGLYRYDNNNVTLSIYDNTGTFIEAPIIVSGTTGTVSLSRLSTTNGTFSGAVSGITTLGAGNTTIIGFVNAAASVNSAVLSVGSSFVANTTGVFHIGTVNAASHTVGSSFIANSTGVYHTGTVNAASHTVGTSFIANSTQTTYGTPVLLNNSQQLRFQTVNTSAYAYFTQQNDDNFVFYTSNTTYGARAVYSVFANSTTSTLNFAVGTAFNGGIYANASYGTAGQLLTSNGTGVYWSSPGAANVNTAAQYTWTNTHTFSANVSFGNSIGIPTGNSTVSGGLIYFAGLADLNWKMGRNTNGTTKWYYTNNTIDILGANSNLEGIVLGNSLVGGASYFETGHAGTYIAANVTIGNTSSKSTINSTAFSGTANNSTYFDTATWAAPKAIGTGTANSGAFTTVTASGNVTADVIISLNNGGGTNIKIGDDVWLGDINTADTVSIRGQQSANNGYIVFGNADTTTKLGRAGTGPLTYNGAFSVTGVTTLSANLVMANNNITRPVLTGYTEAEVSNTAVTGTWTMDCGAANFFDLTLTGSITISPTNVPPNTRVWSGTIAAKQDATGGRTITWPTGIKWPGGSAPPATTTANAIDIWSLMTYDGGSTWIGSLTVKNVA